MATRRLTPTCGAASPSPARPAGFLQVTDQLDEFRIPKDVMVSFGASRRRRRTSRSPGWPSGSSSGASIRPLPRTQEIAGTGLAVKLSPSGTERAGTRVAYPERRMKTLKRGNLLTPAALLIGAAFRSPRRPARVVFLRFLCRPGSLLLSTASDEEAARSTPRPLRDRLVTGGASRAEVVLASGTSSGSTSGPTPFDRMSRTYESEDDRDLSP